MLHNSFLYPYENLNREFKLTVQESFWDNKCHVCNHDDVIKWKHFPRYWPFARGIHRSPVNSPHRGQWRGVLMFSLICTWINTWVNNREAGDLRRHRAHYDVIVMAISPKPPYAIKMPVTYTQDLNLNGFDSHDIELIFIKCSTWCAWRVNDFILISTFLFYR